MGSCVSKKAARAGTGGKSKVAAPLPVAEKETTRALPPVAEAVDEDEVEEVKEVVLSETPARPPPPEPVKPRQQPEADDVDEDSAPSEPCSASDSGVSVESSAKEKAKAKLLHEMAGAEPEAEKTSSLAAANAPRKGRKTLAPPQPEEKEGGKVRNGGAGGGNARARSPSPSSAAHNRRQHQQHPPPPAARPRREQPAVVSGIGCRSGRFSPSAARRAAESAAAVRRTHSAREADMALPSKRSLAAAVNGLSRRDAGERSGRRSDSPTGRRAPASPGVTTHRAAAAASPVRKAGKELGAPERGRTRGRDGDEQQVVGGGGGGEGRKVEEGALGQNPSVAMECFIFL